MKHKFIKIISVIVIAAFASQDLARLNDAVGQAWGQAKGEGVSTGVKNDPTPLSPGQNDWLRPLAEGEGESRVASVGISGKEGRPRAYAQREGVEFHVVDVSDLDDINSVLAQIAEMNFKIDSEFKLVNSAIRIMIQNSYQRDKENLFLNPSLRTFLAMAGNRVIGYIVYNSSGEDSVIEYLAVDPDFQKRGVGTMLIRKVFEFARQNKKDSVTVYTPAKNGKDRFFYRRIGRTLSKHYRERFSNERMQDVKFTFWLTRRAAFAQKVSEFFRGGHATAVALDEEGVDRFFKGGYFITCHVVTQGQSRGTVMSPADASSFMKENGVERINVFVNNKDPRKFRASPEYGSFSISNRGIADVDWIYPNLPATGKGYGRTFIGLALLMLYGDEMEPERFAILDTHAGMLRSLRKLYAFDIRPIKKISGRKIRYFLSGLVPLVDADTVHRWYSRNEENRRKAGFEDVVTFRNTTKAITSSILRPRAAGERMGLLEKIGGYKRTRQIWAGEISPEEGISYFRELRERCERALRGEGTAGLPTYGYISDMHGDWKVWNWRMDEMKNRGVDVIVVIGDSMDRRDGGVRIMEDIIRRSEEGQNIVYVLGNHDMFFMASMMGNLDNFVFWVANGGWQTLLDAEIPPPIVDQMRGLNVEYRSVRKALERAIESGENNIRQIDELSRELANMKNWLSAWIGEFVITNERLKNIADWLRNNGKSYFIDAYGTPSIHAAEEGRELADVLGSPRMIHGHKICYESGPADSPLVNTNVDRRAWVMVGPQGIRFIEEGRDIEKGALAGKRFLAQVKGYCEARLEKLEVKLKLTPGQLKDIMLQVRERCMIVGDCKMHSEHLARRLLEEGLGVQVMNGDGHWWVETPGPDGYILDAFPSGLGGPGLQVARSLGDERYIIIKKDSRIAKRLYTGGIDAELTERARQDADSEEFYDQETKRLYAAIERGFLHYGVREGTELARVLANFNHQLEFARRKLEEIRWKKWKASQDQILSAVLRPRAVGETDWIILPDGARVHRTARIDADCVIEGPNTVIGAGAVITRGSIIRNAIVGAGAYIEKSLVATIDDTDKWMYKPKSEFLVESQKPAVVEKGAKVIRSVVYSSRIGENTQLRQTTVEHSDVGRDNYFKMAKLSLAKTKHNVFATWAELSEGVFGWGFHYDGLALGGPAYFEGIYSNRFPVAMVPGADLSRMTQKELTGLIKGPAKLKAFLRRIRFKSIRGVPHVSLYSPYNIYSVFTGKNLPPKSGILEEIRGEPGEQLSQHARNATGPTAAVAANTDIAPRIMGRPDPTRPRDILINPEYTHLAGFSVSGFNGPMVHGQLRPGAESHSLSPAQINHLWAFTHCPAAVFEMMERIAAALPEGQKGRFDDLAVKAIETAFLMTLYDLNAAQSELRELERKTAKTNDDKKRIASLKKLEKNLIKGLGIYVKNLRENRRRNIWRFKNGQKSISWRHRGKGLWENNYADLAKLSSEARAAYRQYKLRDVLSISSVKPRRPPKTVLTNMDFGLISGKIKGEGQPAVLMADTAHIGKNVRFFGNGKVIIRGNVKLENVVIISDGTVVIDENTNIALGKIEATEGQEVYISKDVTLNYAYVRNSEVSAGTKGYYVRLTASRIGEKNELNPFADIGDTKTDAQCIIGHVMRHCNLARGFISRHLATEAYYLVTPPVVIKIEDKEYIIANPMNIGAGAHIMGKKGRPVAIAGGAFIGSNAWINPDARIESSFVLGEVPEGKILLPLTFYNSGTGEEIVGGLLEEKWAGVLFRTFIYRGKLYTAPENRGAGDYFVPNIISNLAREAVSAQVSRHGIFELIERARPRWEMAGHRFINGRWKYRKRADAWKWEPSRRQNAYVMSYVLRPMAAGERAAESPGQNSGQIEVVQAQPLFSFSLPEEKDRKTARRAALFIADELNKRLQEIGWDLYSTMLEVEGGALVYNNVTVPCYEAAVNLMMYGGGGAMNVYYKKGENKLTAVAVDNNEGSMNDPERMLEDSIDTHRKARSHASNGGFLLYLLEQGGFEIRNIAIFPQRIALETNGSKYVKIGGSYNYGVDSADDEIAIERELGLVFVAPSPVTKGTRLTMEWWGGRRGMQNSFGIGVSGSGVLPHRGPGNVNECVVRALYRTLYDLRTRASHNHMTDYNHMTRDDEERFDKFARWFEKRSDAGEPLDEVPPRARLPIHRLTNKDDNKMAEEIVGAPRLRVVRLPVEELGRIKGEPFYAHLAFEDGVIWVADNRYKTDIELQIMHEAAEYAIALKEARIRRINIRQMARWRDSDNPDALEFFYKAHIAAWEMVVEACRDERRRNVFPITKKERVIEGYKKTLKIADLKIEQAKIFLREAQTSKKTPIPASEGIAIISSEGENSRNSRSLLESI